MTIQLTLDPVVEEKLSALAAAKGIAPDEYVSLAVAQVVGTDPTRTAPFDQDAFNDYMDRLTSISRGHPMPEGETYSREMIYADEPTLP